MYVYFGVRRDPKKGFKIFFKKSGFLRSRVVPVHSDDGRLKKVFSLHWEDEKKGKTLQFMFDLTFDHYTIRAKDLDKSADFYMKVLGLSEIKNRTQKPHIRWFSMGEGRELHIAKGNSDIIKTNVGVHIALRLIDFDGFLSHLNKHNINRHNSKGIQDSITTRADGIRQVYFQDPDGYWIEVNEAETLSNK